MSLEGRPAPAFDLEGTDASTLKTYEAWGMKAMYGKKTEGTIRSTVVIGPDGVIHKHWTKVRNAADHPREVVKYLESV